MQKLLLVDNGLSIDGTFPAALNRKLESNGGFIYAANGRVIDGANRSIFGTFSGVGFGTVFTLDPANNRAYFITNSSQLRAYEMDTLRLVGSVNVTFNGTPRNLVRWGKNGVAFNTDTGRIYFVQTSLIDAAEPVPTPTPTVTPTPAPTPSVTPLFVRRVNIPTNDIAFNSQEGSIVATVPGAAGSPIGNTITHINPQTGEVLSSVFIGSEPTKMAVSDDGGTLWSVLEGSNSIRRYDLNSKTSGLQFAPPSGYTRPSDMEVLPGHPETLLLAAGTNGVAAFDDGVQRPTVYAPTSGTYAIEPAAVPDVLYAYDGGSALSKLTVAPSGVTGTPVSGSLLGGSGLPIEFANGILYSLAGRAVDPEAKTVLGSYQANNTAMAVDPALNRAYFISGSNNVLSAYDLTTFVKLGSVTLPSISGTPASLTRWGENGLVFRTANTTISGNQLYFIQSTLVSPNGVVPTSMQLSASGFTGFESSFPVSVTVTRSGDISNSTSVDYATADGTATAGLDYTATSGTLSFASGESSKNISIPAINDNIFEGTESFSISLRNPAGSNANLFAPDSATVTILDNDSPPRISGTNITVTEPRPGDSFIINVPVTLSNPSVQTVTVNFGTADGTATAGSDYVGRTGTVTFGPGSTTQTIVITLNGDTAPEPNEGFHLNLVGITNGILVDAQATATVFDDDGEVGSLGGASAGGTNPAGRWRSGPESGAPAGDGRGSPRAAGRTFAPPALPPEALEAPAGEAGNRKDGRSPARPPHAG
jgi:hypothetical protein